ncbi:uncharacterized protein [Amphiura filiformis]|uniref:uncharacterized protein n=1 Tax=Amphiura filiformis TaxID=82378 RepID=UPI003B220273
MLFEKKIELKMKTSAILVILVACVMVYQVEAWPFMRSQDGSQERTTPTTPTSSPQNESTTPPVSTTPEPLTFWTRLYNKLKEIFFDNSNDPNTPNITDSSEVSTFEPLKTTHGEATTEWFEEQGFFEGFFGSLANRFASLYAKFGTQWTNSSMDELSEFKMNPEDLLANEVDTLLQKYPIAMEGITDFDNLKTSIVDALVSAWNSSLDINDFPVVSPEEIQDKILETLQELNLGDQLTNNTGIVASTQAPTKILSDSLPDADEVQANFLAILKKAERRPDAVSFAGGASSNDDEVKEEAAPQGNWFNQFMRRARNK